MAVVPVEIVILAFAYILLLFGIGARIGMLQKMGAIFVLVMGVMFLSGTAGIDRDSLIALAIGTISIGLGGYYLIEDSFSHFRQADHPDVDHDDGRFHDDE